MLFNRKGETAVFKGRGLEWLALGLFAIVYSGATAAVGVYFMDWSFAESFIYFFCFEFLLIGIAYDISISIVALVGKPSRLPRLSRLSDYPRVALLITLCDDTSQEILDLLDAQDYPSYNVYLLDDSTKPTKRAIADAYRDRFHILRRQTRAGFKAGNLNNWLDSSSFAYKYFAILDSDSKLPRDFLSRMVEYAEHPANERVAVFQSKIYTWNTQSFFARMLGALSPLRMFILERTSNRFGNILSYGHNVLCRTDLIGQVGGFPEMITAEDTGLTLILDAKGYSTKLVDVVSYDGEPEDVFRYVCRTARWAKQTAEIFRFPWTGASYFLKLSLCYNLYTYVRPFIYFVLLFLMISTSLTSGFVSYPDEAAQISSSRPFFDPWLIVLTMILGVWILPLLLQLLLALRVRIPLYCVLLNGLLSVALMHLAFVPVTLGMLQVLFGKSVVFLPTNSLSDSRATLGRIAWEMKIPLILSGAGLISMALQNQLRLFGFHSVWVAFIIATPLILWLVQGRRGRAES